jgi:hypothetical protein
MTNHLYYWQGHKLIMENLYDYIGDGYRYEFPVQIYSEISWWYKNTLAHSKVLKLAGY